MRGDGGRGGRRGVRRVDGRVRAHAYCAQQCAASRRAALPRALALGCGLCCAARGARSRASAATAQAAGGGRSRPRRSWRTTPRTCRPSPRRLVLCENVCVHPCAPLDLYKPDVTLARPPRPTPPERPCDCGRASARLVGGSARRVLLRRRRRRRVRLRGGRTLLLRRMRAMLCVLAPATAASCHASACCGPAPFGAARRGGRGRALGRWAEGAAQREARTAAFHARRAAEPEPVLVPRHPLGAVAAVIQRPGSGRRRRRVRCRRSTPSRPRPAPTRRRRRPSSSTPSRRTARWSADRGHAPVLGTTRSDVVSSDAPAGQRRHHHHASSDVPAGRRQRRCAAEQDEGAGSEGLAGELTARRARPSVSTPSPRTACRKRGDGALDGLGSSDEVDSRRQHAARQRRRRRAAKLEAQ